jgi:hypothetical protein
MMQHPSWALMYPQQVTSCSQNWWGVSSVDAQAPTRHLGANKRYASKHIYILLLKTIPFLVQQNVGLVQGVPH